MSETWSITNFVKNEFQKQVVYVSNNTFSTCTLSTLIYIYIYSTGLKSISDNTVSNYL